MEEKELGIIVCSIEHKEKNQITSVFTKNGYKSIYVYNSKDYKKGNMGFCFPYTLVEYTSRGQDMKHLLSYDIIKRHQYIRDDFDRSMYAYAMLFLLKTEHEARYDKRIFDFILTVFSKMKDIVPQVLYSIFLAKMTIIFGGKPHFNSCVICGNTKIVGFSILNGGFVCAQHNPVDNYENAKTLQALYELNLENDEIPDFDVNSFLRFISDYYKKLALANLYDVKKILHS